MTRVVVVGATGQIGRPLCAELLRGGHAVVVFSPAVRPVPRPGCRPPRLAAGAEPAGPDGPGRDHRHPGQREAGPPGQGERARLPVPLSLLDGALQDLVGGRPAAQNGGSSV